MRYRHRRGQRTDIFISVLRDEAENRFAQLFGEAARLKDHLSDPAFSDVEYDARVSSIACSTLMTIRPISRYLRVAIAELIAVETDRRSSILTVNTQGGAIKRRWDFEAVDSLVEILGLCLYEPGTYIAGVTDIASGLEGLSLTFARDIASEADSDGLIVPEAVRRLCEKVRHASRLKATSSVERRLELIALLERAISLDSGLTLASSAVRETRIGRPSERNTDVARDSADKHFRVGGMADPSHPIYQTGYIIGSLANTIRGADQQKQSQLKLLSNEP